MVKMIAFENSNWLFMSNLIDKAEESLLNIW